MSRMQKLGQIDSELGALNRELNALLTVGPRDALQCGCEDGENGNLAEVIGRLNGLKTNGLLLLDKKIGLLPNPDSYETLVTFRHCCESWQRGWSSMQRWSALSWSTAFGHWVVYIREIETELNSGYSAIPKIHNVCEKLYQIYISNMTVFHKL
jgi:hypothetical protein